MPPRYQLCAFCSPTAAYENKEFVPPGQDGSELYQACGCSAKCHRHCVNQRVLEGKAKEDAALAACPDCGKRLQIDDRTAVFIEGAATAAPEIKRLKEEAGDTFRTFFKLQETVGELQIQLERWQWGLGLWAAAATATSVWLGFKCRSAGRG